MKSFILLFSVCLLYACEYDVDTNPNYVEGEIIVNLYDTSSFRATYYNVKSYNIEIQSLYNFGYSSKTDSDSVEIIRSVLSDKLYLNDGGKTFSIKYNDSLIKIKTGFFNINQKKAIDWFVTVDKLRLKEDFDNNYFIKWGLLNVPRGDETEWVAKLRSDRAFKYVELKHTLKIN